MKNYIIRKPEHKKKIIIDPLATSIVDPFEKIKISDLIDDMIKYEQDLYE